MNRQEKETTINSLKTQFETSPFVVFVDYRKVTVAEIDQVRRDCEAKDLRYLVAKNTFIRKAVEGTEKEVLAEAEFLHGMTGIIFSGEDAISSAKVVRELVKVFAKKEKFTVKGGFFDGDILNVKGVDQVADFLSRDDLLALMLRTIQEGPRQAIGVIQAPARDLLYLLRNYESSLS
jgi:large subunit ribosomal protein L10